MSVLGDIRKLLFGAKAVASSAANKAVEAGKEAGEELVEKSSELLEKATDKAGELYEKASDKAGELYTAAKEKVDDLTESIWNTAANKQRPAEPTTTPPQDADEFVAANVFEAPKADLHMQEDPYNPTPEPNQDFVDATEEKAAQVGSKLQEKTAELKEKLRDVAEDVGAKLAEKGSEALDRAREVGGQFKEKWDSLVDKAQQEADKDRQEQEAIRREAERQQTEWQKRAADKSAGSTLGGMDSFFEKAQRFADGDYHNTGGTSTPDDPNVLELKPDPNFKKEKKDTKIPGMDDLDGDGNELIDDAIIDKD